MRNIFTGIATFFKPLNYLAKSPFSTETEPLLENKTPSYGPVAPWGKDNYFPTLLDDQVGKSIDLEAGFQTLSEFTYGLRVSTYIEEMGLNNEPIRRVVYDPDFEEWKEKYAFNELFLQRGFYNFFRYANAFIEFSFNIKTGKIERLFTKDSPYCRISTLNPKTGLSDYLYQSAQWKTPGLSRPSESTILEYLNKKLLSRIPLIDVRNPIDFIKNYTKPILLGYHIKDYSPGDPYYGKSSWYPLLNNGWMDIAAKAPSMLKSYYDNSITIAHHIEYNIDYFEKSVSGWADLTPDEKESTIKQFQDNINKSLAGGENAHKSIFTQFRPAGGGSIESQLKINSISNPLKDSSIIKDLQYVSSTCKAALRLDSSLNGDKNDGSKEADAGSEKMRANNLLQQRLNMVRDQFLYLLTITKHVNEWNPKLKFSIELDHEQLTSVAPSGNQIVM